VTPPVAVFDRVSPPRRRERRPRPALRERIDRGMERYRRMDEAQRADVRLVADSFTGWNDAYESSMAVCERMKADPDFDIDVLVSQIRFLFADFLLNAVEQFMLDGGLG
jgi:hypothetical protein